MGRRKGIPNKVTTEFRAVINKLLEDNAPNFQRWLKQVAEGDPELDIKPNPAKALDIVGHLAEYAAPKQSRVEHVGEGGGPLQLNIVRFSETEED